MGKTTEDGHESPERPSPRPCRSRAKGGAKARPKAKPRAAASGRRPPKTCSSSTTGSSTSSSSSATSDISSAFLDDPSPAGEPAPELAQPAASGSQCDPPTGPPDVFDTAALTPRTPEPALPASVGSVDSVDSRSILETTEVSPSRRPQRPYLRQRRRKLIFLDFLALVVRNAAALALPVPSFSLGPNFGAHVTFNCGRTARVRRMPVRILASAGKAALCYCLLAGLSLHLCQGGCRAAVDDTLGHASHPQIAAVLGLCALAFCLGSCTLPSCPASHAVFDVSCCLVGQVPRQQLMLALLACCWLLLFALFASRCGRHACCRGPCRCSFGTENGPTIRPFDVLLPKHTRITEVSHSLIQAIDWTL